jgi:hypothetical protein
MVPIEFSGAEVLEIEVVIVSGVVTVHPRTG